MNGPAHGASALAPRAGEFEGAVVLVTGGSRGLGFAMARAFARAGATVVVSSRKAEACEAAVRTITADGGRAVAYPCHVGRWAGTDSLVESIYDAFGQLDVLVNNAGIAPSAPTSLATTEELFDKSIAVNLKGPFRLMATAGGRMRDAGRGSIINITSTAAIRPVPEYAVYSAAKGGLNLLTRAFALELGPAVRVNAIMAGPFRTDISREWADELDRRSDSALRRIGRPEEIVSTALYLASDAASFTTGAVIEVSGGIR